MIYRFSAHIYQKINFRVLNLLIAAYALWLLYEFSILNSIGIGRYQVLTDLWFPVFIFGLISAGLLILNKFLSWAFLSLYLLVALLVFQFPSATELHFQYLGWALLFLFVRSLTRDETDLKWLKWCYWICFGYFYSYLGITKLMSEAWISGEGIRWLLLWSRWNEFVYRYLYDLSYYSFAAYSLAILQLFALPCIWHRASRLFIWSALTVFQIGLALTTEFHHIALAVLLFHMIGLLLVKEDGL